MNVCFIARMLSYIALIYIIGSIYYTIRTKNIGTPFKDAMKKYPELMNIKLQQVQKRGNIFKEGILIGIVLMLVMQPFSECLIHS